MNADADASRGAHSNQPTVSDSNAERLNEADYDILASAVRVLLGSVLEGKDEFVARLRTWDSASTAAPIMTTNATAPDQMRYAVIGMLMDARTRLQQGMYTAELFADRLAYIYEISLGPVLERTPARRLLTRIDDLLFHGRLVMDRWAESGRVEELRGRQVARQAVNSIVEEMVDRLAQSPEVRELVRQQRETITDAAVSEVRGHTATADDRVERLVRGLLRRPEMDRHATLAASAPEQPTGDQSG